MNERVQDTVVRFLAEGAGLGHEAVVIATHISRVFLLPDRVLKLKRAVKLPYVDFSTLPQRIYACEREVELNRRTAPSLYRGICHITRERDGSLALDGAGEIVDVVVDMERFEQDCLFHTLLDNRKLNEPVMTRLARRIAGFHAEAETVASRDGTAALHSTLRANEASFAENTVFARQDYEALFDAFRQRLEYFAPLLNERARQGKIRRCHGDLHLRNICLIDGEPVLFDCIEFNDELSEIDVLYDLAFLLMDLWHRGERRFANLVLNRYLDVTADEEGYALLPFFMALRAMVRALVLATQAETEMKGDREKTTEIARSYFLLAQDLLQARDAQLVALSGFSGSGKSTIAEALAGSLGGPPGARIIESDRIRKALFGVSAETRLPGGAYRPVVSRQVYAEMMRRIQVILQAHGAVVANAVWDRPADRTALEELAQKCRVPFLGFQLVLTPEALRQRIAGRATGSSDATVEVLARQLEQAQSHRWWQPLDASRSPQQIVVQILGHAAVASPLFER